MREIKARWFGMKRLTSLIPVFIILGLAVMPYLIQSQVALVPLTFEVTEKSLVDDAVVLQGRFMQRLPEQEILWLYAEDAEIDLYVNGVHTRYNTREDTPKMFRSPGRSWFVFLSPGIDAGETVHISVHSYYGENERAMSNLLTRLYRGDGGDLYKLLLGQIGFLGLLQMIALVAGLIYLAEGAIDVTVGMYDDGIRITIFGFYCLSGGLWCVTDALYPYLTLLITPPWMATILDMTGLLLFPIALAIMIRYYMRGRKTRYALTVVLIAEIITAVVCVLLQFTGKFDFVELQIGIGIVALLALVVAVVYIVIELRHYRDGYLLLLLLTVLPVFIAIAVDGINVLWPFMPRRIMMRYSFGISLLLLVLQFVSYADAELVKARTLHKMERELAESRISIMISQIQPHFLYNALVGIKQLCDSDPKRASEALDHFSYYLRGNLDSIGNTGLIPFAKELEHLRNYLYLEKMRFPKKLNVVYEIDYQDFMLPPLSVQSIVENAVRYGLMKKKGGGTLTIASKKTENLVVITIRDDGVGFNPIARQEDSRSHVGIENVCGRLQSLCEGTLCIESEEGVGTMVKIILPQKGETLCGLS